MVSYPERFARLSSDDIDVARESEAGTQRRSNLCVY